MIPRNGTGFPVFLAGLLLAAQAGQAGRYSIEDREARTVLEPAAGAPFARTVRAEPVAEPQGRIRSVVRDRYNQGGAVDLAEPHTLRFALRLEEDARFSSRDDYLHIVESARDLASTGTHQTWGLSIRGDRSITFWNGDGAGGVAGGVLAEGVRAEPGETVLFTIEVIPGEGRWTATVEAGGRRFRQDMLGFRSEDRAVGGQLHVAALLSTPERTLRYSITDPVVTGGVSEAAINPPGENRLRNAGFRAGRRLADIFAWHRMTGIDYLVREDDGWRVDTDESAVGDASLRADPGALPLIVPAEIWDLLPGPAWTFSAYLRADHEETRVRLEVGSYRHHDQEWRRREVSVGRAWRRFALPVESLHRGVRRTGRIQGPVNFVIRPLDGATVWVDGLQWEPVSVAGRWTVSQRDSLLPVEGFDWLPGGAPPSADRTGRSERERAADIGLFVDGADGQATRAEVMSLGVPFPVGRWNGNGRLWMVDGRGETLPVQTEPLARWPSDGTVQSLEVSFAADIAPGRNRFRLRIEPDALAVPAGDSMLARREDGSIEVRFAGRRMHVRPESGRIWESIHTEPDGDLWSGPAELRAEGLDGTSYGSGGSPRTETLVEREGPLRVTLATRGFLSTGDRKHALLTYIVRTHLWRDEPGVRIEVTLVNSHGEDSVALREAYLQGTGAWERAGDAVYTPWGRVEPEAPVVVLQAFDFGNDHFVRARTDAAGSIREERPDERGPLWLAADAGGTGIHLQAIDAWRRHPSMLRLEPSGAWRAYLWPSAPVMGLEFSRGLSVTREFVLRETAVGQDTEARAALGDRLDQRPLPRTDPAWFAETNLFMPLHPSRPEERPFIEDRLAPAGRMGPLSPEIIEARGWYGMFDYGDHTGDGGWANLESYHDYAAILRGVRADDSAVLRQGLDSARHYRDVDINQISGRPITHSANHVIGGTGFGHAWPQGVYAHYLLTGSRRSLEVMLRNGEAMLSMGVEDGDIADGRNLGYFLLTLADIYQVTGDARYRDRFFAQLAHVVPRLSSPPDEAYRRMQRTSRPLDGSLFYWRDSGIVPFALWYGTAGLIKMYEMTGEESLRAHIDREVAVSMDVDLLYRYHIEQLWPGLPAEDSLPLMADQFVAGRGSYFYPVMAAYARMTGEDRWQELALRVLYAGVVKGRPERTENILAAAALVGIDAGRSEASLIGEARDLIWRAAAPTLPNGDFTRFEPYDRLLARLSGHDYTPAFATPWRYPYHWRLSVGKELTATGQMRTRPEMAVLDDEIFKVNAPSLRMTLDAGRAHARRVNIDSARFRIEPGIHRLSLWLRGDTGTGACRGALFTSDMRGMRDRFVFEFQPGQPEMHIENPTAIQIVRHSLAPPEEDGWQHLTVDFRTETRRVGSVYVGATLAAGAQRGALWLDGIRVASLAD